MTTVASPQPRKRCSRGGRRRGKRATTSRRLLQAVKDREEAAAARHKAWQALGHPNQTGNYSHADTDTRSLDELKGEVDDNRKELEKKYAEIRRLKRDLYATRIPEGWRVKPGWRTR